MKKKLAFLPGVWYSDTDGKRETKSGRNSIKIFKEYDQKQTYLLPPSLEDFVGPEHSARIISDEVKGECFSQTDEGKRIS